MPLLPCKDQEARIAALEAQVNGIYEVLKGLTNLPEVISDKLKEEFHLAEQDPTQEAYHR